MSNGHVVEWLIVSRRGLCSSWLLRPINKPVVRLMCHGVISCSCRECNDDSYSSLSATPLVYSTSWRYLVAMWRVTGVDSRISGIITKSQFNWATANLIQESTIRAIGRMKELYVQQQRTLRMYVRRHYATDSNSLSGNRHRMSSPPYLSSLLNDHIPSRTLRPSSTPRLVVPRTRTELAKRAFCVAAPSLWNSLPVDVVDTNTLSLSPSGCGSLRWGVSHTGSPSIFSSILGILHVELWPFEIFPRGRPPLSWNCSNRK